MENFNLGRKNDQKNEPKKESVSNKVSNFVKAALLSKLLDKSKINKSLADNLYANRILEEELVAPDKSFSEFTPSLPEGTKIIDVHGSHYANIGDKMYFIRDFKEGFDLVDNTKDFIPYKGLYRREYKRRAFFQKKYGLSTATKATHDDEFYRYNESVDDLDDWIIHNDKGQIKKNRFNKDETWWLKGEPYKAMEQRSLIKDNPAGRHLFAKQSALEASIGRPLDQHRELIGDIIKKGDIKDGGITVTPTREADLPNIKGLKSFTYNPITKSMERGIFYNPKEPKDEKDVYKNLSEREDTEK
jgi:hypothetical protein